MEFFLREVYPWLIELSAYSSGVPFVAGILLYRKRSSLEFRLLFFYVVFLALTEIVSYIVIYTGTKNNMWLSHLELPVEFTLLAGIYYYALKQPLLRGCIIAAVIGLCIINAVSLTWGEGISQMNTLPRMLSAALLIAMAILYLYQVANTLVHTYLDRDPVFILSCGIIIYQAGTAMAYGMFNAALAESYDAARMCITVILVLNVLFRLLLMLALKRAPAV